MLVWTPKNFMPTPFLLLGAAELLILYSSLFVGALIIYGSIADGEIVLEWIEPRAAVVALVMLISLVSMGLYDFRQRISFREILIRIAAGLALGSLVLAAIFYAIPSIMVTRELSFVAVLYATMSLLVLRYFFTRRIDENIFRHRILVYGAGKRASTIADLRRKADRRGFEIVGSIPAPGDKLEFKENGPLFTDKDIDLLAPELDVDQIVIAMDNRRGNLPLRQMLNCKLQGIDVIDLLEFLERETGKIRIDLVNPGWLIFGPGFRNGRIRELSKRSVDLIATTLILSLSWPLMLLIAVAIKIEDGPKSTVLYRQKRVGSGSVPFRVFKFRSMREDAEADGEVVWAEEHDDRITRVGKVLRKYRLDELPQVFNVLRGQMSLVGPRPERPAFVEQLTKSIPYYSERHTVKPGITGWAQMRYAYGASEEDSFEKLQFDLYYIKNHSFLLDVLIILQTVEVVLWGKGAR